MVSIDFLVLTKNNDAELWNTLYSIPNSEHNILINVIIVDGSDEPKAEKNLRDIFMGLSIVCRYFWTPEIRGIYPSMNFALDKVASDWFLFLNSGDSLHPSFTLANHHDMFLKDSFIVFGQAEILSNSPMVSWLVPDSKVKSISNWLAFFEPSHQAMFVRKSLARVLRFDETSPVCADAPWKRYLLSNYKYTYLKMPITIFRLGGISSVYSWRVISIKLKEPSRTFHQKMMEIIKFFLYKLGIFLPRMQKIKSLLIGRIF